MKPPPERDRLMFIVETQGFEAALDFAKRTMVSYRRAVLSKIGMCTTKRGRASFIESYLAFKKFIRMNEGMQYGERKYGP